MVERSNAPSAWVGFLLRTLGEAGLACWAGAIAGWLALSWARPGGGWGPVLGATSAVVVALPSLALLAIGVVVGRRARGRMPAWPRRVARSAMLALGLGAAVLAFLAGWPR